MQSTRKGTTTIIRALALATLLSCIGCSAFPGAQRTVSIKVNGMNYPHAEIIFYVETPNESDLDIFLSDHYAIRLGLQWLVGQEDIQQFDNRWIGDNEQTPLVPWLTCKYRF